MKERRVIVVLTTSIGMEDVEARHQGDIDEKIAALGGFWLPVEISCSNANSGYQFLTAIIVEKQ